MFGILVPLPLREAKKSFVSALDGAIEVLNARHALQRLEEEVHKLKNQKDCPVEDESKSTKSENNDCSSVWAESNKR
ncbi:hypothetical protein TRICI_002938 [Trichomonascus ciferrii]|uniref:Uncharacterized protein n=1 Tax=Trichomonascus ciferrii TaxID=44093 RepID=A0A642VAF1_9ASCO|nr:hypothetical protein TRICI_002938 [Trichomonascus ciferrii]